MRGKYIHGVYSACLRRHARFDTLPPQGSHTRTPHPRRTSTEAPAAAPWHQHWDSRGSATAAELSAVTQRCSPGTAMCRAEDVGAALAWSVGAPRSRQPQLASQPGAQAPCCSARHAALAVGGHHAARACPRARARGGETGAEQGMARAGSQRQQASGSSITLQRVSGCLRRHGQTC